MDFSGKKEAGLDGKKRCFGNKPGQELYAEYHDNEWGIPVHDDRKLFEMLILEGAQAGLIPNRNQKSTYM